MRPYCYLTIRGDKVIIESSYDAPFIERLKTLVPHTARSWDPEQKKWTVSAAHLDRIKALVRERYDRAWLVEGGITTDLRTGETVDPMSLEV